MTVRPTPIVVHLLGAALASALLAFWVLRLIAPASPIPPASTLPAAAREPDAALAGRMFGDVGSGALASLLNVQVSGVFAAGKASSAVISVDGKPPRAVLLGQDLSAGVRLAEVRPDGVTLEHDGARTQYNVPPAEVAKASVPVVTYRREGATLTAPSLDVATAVRAPAGQQNPGAAAAGSQQGSLPGHIGLAPESQFARRQGRPLPPSAAPTAPAVPGAPASPPLPIGGGS